MSLLGYFGRPLSIKNPKGWGNAYGARTWSGETINADTAMHIAAVWRAIRLIASTQATLPFGLVAADGDGQSGKDAGVPLDAVIRSTPNADMSAVTFWESMFGAQELTGNAFARKDYTGSGPSRQVIGLKLLNPWGVSPQKTPAGVKYWRYVDSEGVQFEYAWDDLFHLKQFSFDGCWGLSTVAYGSQALGTARAADRTAGEMFKSGMSGSGFLETGQVLNEGDRQRLQALMNEYAGTGNVGRIMILEGGMSYKPLSMSAEDAELLHSRKWNVEEIARLFDMPPVMLGHNPEGGTNWGSGVEAQIRSWYQLGLRSRIRRVQAEVERQLMNAAQRAKWSARMNVDALLQGDSETQARVWATYVQNGIRTRAEIRKLQDLPPIGGADQLTAQTNLAPLATLGQNPDGGANNFRAALRSFLGLADEIDPTLSRDRPPGQG